MKRRIFLVTLLFLTTFFLPGCWDYIEYEGLSQIIGLGIDYDPITQKKTITIQFTGIKKGLRKPSEESGAPTGEWVTQSVTDTTVFGALQKFQETHPERLFFGYLRIIVFGEEAARYNLMSTIDFLARTPVLRSSALMVISQGKAEDTIKTLRISKSFSSSVEIHDLLKTGMYSGVVYPVSLDDFLQMLAISGWEATAPYVITASAEKDDKGNSQESKGSSKDAKSGVLDNIRFSESRTGAQRLAGMAVFKADKLVGWLNEQESQGFGWIKFKGARTYKVTGALDKADADNQLFYRVIESNSKVKVQMENDKPIVTINVNASADLRKYYRNEGSDLISNEEISKAEKMLSDSISADINAALQKCQKDLRSDVFGFGFAFFREYPKLWQEGYEDKWDDVFPDIQVYVNVDAKVVNSGQTIKRLIIK